MSSMRSASSRINTSTWFNFTKPWLMRSRSRPGVATRMSTPFPSRSVCAPCPTPQKMTVWRRPELRPYAVRESPIWMASSRVGVNMSERMTRGCFVSAERSSISGSEKAAVFPVPVCAQPMRSWRERITGMEPAWIGVGVEYPSDSRALRIGSESPRSRKWVKIGQLVERSKIVGLFSKKESGRNL